MIESIKIDLAQLGVSQGLIDSLVEKVALGRLKCAIEAMQDKDIQFVDSVLQCILNGEKIYLAEKQNKSLVNGEIARQIAIPLSEVPKPWIKSDRSVASVALSEIRERLNEDKKGSSPNRTGRAGSVS